MARDDDGSVEALMPVFGPPRPAPDHEARDARQDGELVNRVFEDAGVQTAAVGGFRMSPHVYNTPEHVDRVVAALKKNRAMLA